MAPEKGGIIGPALVTHSVVAEVVDVDTYRLGFGLESDYIIRVGSSKTKGGGEQFETFEISKSFSQFRSLASDLRRAAQHLGTDTSVATETSASVKSVKKVAQSVSLLIDKEGVQYVGKVSYTYVKNLSKQRRSIIDIVLAEIVEHYPTGDDGNPAVKAFTRAVESFLLTDVVVEEDADDSATKKGSKFVVATKAVPPTPSTPDKKVQVKARDEAPPLLSPSVVPKSRKTRRSMVVRKQDEQMLKSVGADLVLGDEDTASEERYSSPASAAGVLDGPLGFFILAVVAVYVLFVASRSSVTVDSDIALLIGFACYCLGIHSPRPAADVSMGEGTSSTAGVVTGVPSTPRRAVTFREERRPASTTRRPTMQEPAGALLRKSMRSIKPIIPESVAQSLEALVEGEDELGEEPVLVEEPEKIVSPMPVFPEGAKLGTVMNCWSEPTYEDFKVRGKNYLNDRVKVPSGPFLFPVRGVDLFLTDACPENVGRNTGIMGGKLRDVPTMIINFRLPWGVLLYYFEIPTKFVPFVKYRYDPSFDKSKLPSMDGFSGAELAAARYLQGDDEHKNATLKIVPVVVQGPWVVKSVVGGKPAIIGTKMPVSYFYQAAEPEQGKAEYLEMDLDIVASSAARGILSVVRGYTSILTMDLGFVIQGNAEEELPEQMLVGARLHSIDPMTAPALPPMKDIFSIEEIGGIDSMGSYEE